MGRHQFLPLHHDHPLPFLHTLPEHSPQVPGVFPHPCPKHLLPVPSLPLFHLTYTCAGGFHFCLHLPLHLAGSPFFLFSRPAGTSPFAADDFLHSRLSSSTLLVSLLWLVRILSFIVGMKPALLRGFISTLLPWTDPTT